MALRAAWWMQSGSTPATPPRQFNANPSYKGWPWNGTLTGISFHVLERTLRDNPGSACQVDKYRYVPREGTWPRWEHGKSVSNVSDLLDLLERQVSRPQNWLAILAEVTRIRALSSSAIVFSSKFISMLLFSNQRSTHNSALLLAFVVKLYKPWASI